MPNELRGENLSHDPEVIENHKRDRFVNKVATARWFTEMTAAQAYCLANAARLAPAPLFLVAGDDPVASAPAARQLFEVIQHPQKKLIVYPGFFHEVLNETGRAQVFADVDEWLSAHG
jgi:alpha-beta hydrolase superfamily lysophospholipase